jgi:hypothetical protein
MSVRIGRRWKFAAAMVASAALSLTLGGAANAAAVSSFAPDTLVKALQDAGYKAKLSKDDDGDPLIETAAGGEAVTIHFAGCTKAQSCDQIEFATIWNCEKEKKACTESAAKWNGDENFSHAIMVNEFAVLYYHLLLDQQGISPALFIRSFELFANDMMSFEGAHARDNPRT